MCTNNYRVPFAQYYIYSKSLFSSAQGDNVDGDQEAEAIANASPTKDSTTSSNSVESLFSLHSGQSSSSSKLQSQISISSALFYTTFLSTVGSDCGKD